MASRYVLAIVGVTAIACGMIRRRVSPLSSVMSAWNSPISVSSFVPLPLKHPSIVLSEI